MRLKLDENLPESAGIALRLAGHDADDVHEEGLVGEPDDCLLRAAVAADRILLTLDMGFSDVRAYPPATSAGIIVLRPRVANKTSILGLIDLLIPLLANESPRGQL